MDPDTNLEEQLRIAERILRQSDDDGEIDDYDSIRLAELVGALDGWLRGGGFLPSRWD